MGEVMLIGHNPAIEQLARELARPSRARAELEQKFPTAALATLEFAAASCRELSRDGAALISVVRPRDLES
jgi:phosphohistidine phosphatase